MAGARSKSFILVAILGLIIQVPLSLASSSPSTQIASTSATTAQSTSTCQSRTINYITHTLPQQCLRTSRIPTYGANATNIESAAEGAHATGNETSNPAASSTATTPETAGAAASNIADSTKASTPPPISVEVSDKTTVADPSQTPAGSSSVEEPLASSTLAAESEVEPDSPLDNANFLSFEEWRKQNLARSGQSAEHVGQKRASDQGPETRRRPGSINNALDSLGEDTEIELDFAGFVSGSSGSPESPSSTPGKAKGRDAEGQGPEGSVGADAEGAPPPLRTENRDAGKTCKERFNYASFDCAATVLKTNRKCKASTSVLVENKDSYMLNECSEKNKFIIVELCDIILVDTVVLANFEFFSSIFRTFRVSVSDRYPVKADKWKDLGTFEARNSRDVQPFLVKNPMIWAKYLRVEFLTQYGSEYYCPVSLLRVHGTTMMEEFRHGNEAGRGDDENEDELVADAALATQEADAAMESRSHEAVEGPPHNATSSNKATNESTHADADTTVFGERAVEKDDHGRKRDQAASQSEPIGRRDGQVFSPQELSVLIFNSSQPSCHPSQSPATKTAAVVGTVTRSASGREQTTTSSAPSTASSSSSRHVPSGQPGHSSAERRATQASSSTQTSSSSPPSTANSTESATKPSVSTQQDSTKPQAASQPPSAVPTTQENFFKTIHKRLQLLESNSTLSLQYIEDQSRILRDAFTKVESRQMAKTAKFLETLNATVLTELRGFRDQYDQIWQSTVIELENQREQSQREIIAVSTRLGILADEVVFQKRLSIVQSILLLVCIGLVIFSRSAGSNYLELPVVQNIIARSQTTIRIPFESPSRSRPSMRPSSSWDQDDEPTTPERPLRQSSADSVDMGRSPGLELSPPTPTSLDTQSESEGGEDARGSSESSPAPDERPQTPVTAIRRPLPNQTNSSPAALDRAERTRPNSRSTHDGSPHTAGFLHPESPSKRSKGASSPF